MFQQKNYFNNCWKWYFLSFYFFFLFSYFYLFFCLCIIIFFFSIIIFFNSFFFLLKLFLFVFFFLFTFLFSISNWFPSVLLRTIHFWTLAVTRKIWKRNDCSLLWYETLSTLRCIFKRCCRKWIKYALQSAIRNWTIKNSQFRFSVQLYGLHLMKR